MRTAPCKDCPDRTAECHGSCIKYGLYNALQQRDREHGLMLAKSTAPIRDAVLWNERGKRKGR